MALVPGSSAGPFRIIEPLGRGGMASVYKAYEAGLDRYVALKVLPREFLHDPDFAKRFQREAKAIASLEHPNIVPIYAYDIDQGEGIPWMALRLIGGGSLAQLVRRGPLAPARAVAVLRGVADALDYAHGKGVVHRDVKPQNVLLDESGRVYLADFGIAKILESSGGLTATGMITGTPQYMAPEQATGGKIGPAVDVYAMGIMSYEMLTGHVPFAADTPVAVMMKHVQEPLPLPPPDVVPEPLLRAILKATAKRADDRWTGAGAFVSALEAGVEAWTVPALADVPTIAVPPSHAPTAVAPPTAVLTPTTPPPTAVTRPAGAPTVPSPPRRPPVPPPPARRGRLGPGTVLALVGGAALVLGAAVGLTLLLRRGGEAPAPSPSPTLAAEARATPRPEEGRPVPAATPAPSAAAPAPAAAELRRPTPLVATPTPHPAPLPAPTPATAPTPTPAPARPTEPTAPAVDPEVLRLADALSDRDASTRRRAAQDLAALGPAAAPAQAALVAALSDRNADVRLRATEALGRVGPSGRGAVPALTEALRDADPMVRGEAAKSLGLHGEGAGAAASALGQVLRDKDVGVRREAARALARLGRRAEPALDDLVDALKDKDRTVKAQSARALAGLGPAARGAAPALAALGRDSDLIVAREAQAALEAIGP